mgnify:FL=1
MKQGTLRISVPYTKKPANKPYKTKRLSPPQPKPDDLCNRYVEWIRRTGATRYYVFADTADKMRSALACTAPGLSSLLQEIQVSRADYVFAGVPDNERI